MVELLRDAADIDARPPNAPLAPVRRGLDIVEHGHFRAEPRCLLRHATYLTTFFSSVSLKSSAPQTRQLIPSISESKESVDEFVWQMTLDKRFLKRSGFDLVQHGHFRTVSCRAQREYQPAAERRGDSLKRFKDIYLKAKARIWS